MTKATKCPACKSTKCTLGHPAAVDLVQIEVEANIGRAVLKAMHEIDHMDKKHVPARRYSFPIAAGANFAKRYYTISVE